MRSYNLRRNFGLSVEQYNSLLEVQEQCCALCHKHKDTFKRGYALAVDHDHDTGEIRGLVCYGCNTILAKGLSFFERGVEYLTTKPVDTEGKLIVRKPDVMEVDKHGKILYN
jgi:hypothetical protein